MKKSIILFLLFSIGCFSQTNIEKIQAYLNTNYQKLELTNLDINDWIVESKATSKSTRINNYYIKQRYHGIEIFDAVSNVWVKDNEVIKIGNRFVSNLNQKVNTTTPTLFVLEALNSAKTQLEIPNNDSNHVIQTTGINKFTISNGNLDPIRAKLVFHKVESKLRLAWDFKIDVVGHKHLWSVRIDALSGKILDKNDLVISCSFDSHQQNENKNSFFFNQLEHKAKASILEVQSGSYRVLPYNIESPNHGSRQLITTTGNVLASPFGWHDTDGAEGNEYTITRGNNVHAFEDLNDFDEGVSPDGGANLIFDFPYGGNNVVATEYLNAATTNLFYMNNIVHDVFYQYGFDEENGNFQSNNYGKGGLGDDYVLAQSQDGGGINNANFSVVEDGFNGRMQMYLWNRRAANNLITVNSPSSIAGSYIAIDNNFTIGHIDLPISPISLTANLVLFDDGTLDSSDACEPAINTAQLNGNIAIIRRGNCTTIPKVLQAQNAGAIAVIIVNNFEGNFYLSGFDDTITIPAISVKQSVGELLIAAINDSPVQVSLSSPITDFVNSDSDFDNLVIIHEYGHGISNRLTGGSFNSDCLNNQEQMGEGWSDWFGLMMQMKSGDTGLERRGVGTFLSNQPITDDGIRRYPYSTDMSINPFTFGSTNTAAVPHGVGSVWATMLWDLAWAYVNKYGFNSNIYNGNGGNNKVLQVVVDALKLQPCNPSFVEGRDAILAADQAITGGQDACLIWEVFARRGLGFNASSGDAYSSADQTEDFTRPTQGPNCTLGNTIFQNDEFVKIYPNPNKGNFTLQFNSISNQEIKIVVYDMRGRRIFEKNYENTGIFSQNIQLNNLQSGVYLVNVENGKTKEVKRIIIE